MLRSKRGFTLVELLVVIAIIGILVSLLLPAVQAAREAARRTSCFNNLKQVGLALHNYHDTHRGFPSGWIALEPRTRRPLATGEPGWGWASMLLPYLEQGTVSDNLVHFEYPILDPLNAQARTHVLPIYRCPSDSAPELFDLGEEEDPQNTLATLAVANYVGVFGTEELHMCEELGPGRVCRGDGIFYHHSATNFADVRDGLSNTVFIGERASKFGHSTWVGAVSEGEESIARILGIADHPPNSPGGHLDDFSSQHPAGTNFLFGDGSVRLIAETIELETYHALATRSGGEVLKEF